MNKIRIFLVFVLFIFVSTAIAEEIPHINIEARTKEERATIERTVKDAYPFLPADQQALIRQGLYFVVHYKGIADNDTAFGPEDDPDYRYPDQTLYPKGTIKINFTSALMKHFFIPIYGKGNPVKNAWIRFSSIELVSHEIKHVQQYIAHPINDLREAEDCPEGACDHKRFMDTKKKLQYEHDAMVFGWTIATQAIQKEAADIRYRSDAIPESMTIFYETMHAPVVLAEDCIEDGVLLEDKKMDARYFIKFAEENNLEKVYRYLAPVFARIKTCL